MYNNNFNRPNHAPALFPTIEPLPPDFRSIGSNGGLYDARSGKISAPMDLFLKDKVIDPMGEVRWGGIGGISTGAHVEPINPLLNPRHF